MSLRLQPVDLRTAGWVPPTIDAQGVEDGETNQEQILKTPLKTLTEVSVEGKGVFDALMRATKLHLKEEYDANRITGKEYSTVYLGALTAVLQTSTQFLLNEQQVNEINARIGLIRQQTATELANTDDSIPVGLAFNHIPKVQQPVPPVTCHQP